MKYGIGETFRLGSRLEGEDQIKFMRENFSQALGKMVEYALEPEYVWDLPPGTPPYKVNKFVDQESNLYTDVRRMYIFMKDQGSHVSPIKKEVNFVQMLENVSPDDAIFLLHAKAKSLPFGWTAERIREVYPGLIYDTTVEQPAPDLTPKSDEELGKPVEEIGDPAPLPFSDEQMVAMALGSTIEQLNNPTDTGETIPETLIQPITPTEPVKRAGRPAGSTNKTPSNTKKSGTTAKKPVVQKRKAG